MVYLLGEIAILLALATLLGLVVGWLLWRWRSIRRSDYEALIIERDQRDREIASLKATNHQLGEDVISIRHQSSRAVIDRDSMEDRLTGVLIENARLTEERDELIRQFGHPTPQPFGAVQMPVSNGKEESAIVEPAAAANQVRQPEAPLVDDVVPADDGIVHDHDLATEQELVESDDHEIDLKPQNDHTPDALVTDAFLTESPDATTEADPSEVDQADETSTAKRSEPELDLTDDANQIDLTEASEPEVSIDEPPSESPDEQEIRPVDKGATIVRTVDPAAKAGPSGPKVSSQTAAAIAGSAAAAGTAAGAASEIADSKPGFLSGLFSKRNEAQNSPAPQIDGDLDLFSPGSDQNPPTPSKPAADVVAEASSSGETDRDDLTRIEHVTPALEIFLHNQNIWTFRQLGSLSDSEVSSLQQQLPEHPGILEEQDWVGQARRLYNEKFN